MIETVYSSFAGVEVPVQSIYIMTWKAKLGTKYSAIINENSGRPVEIILVTDDYMEFAKILQTTRDEEIVIDLATVDLESILPTVSLIESDFYEELADETKEKVNEIIAEINKYSSRVQSSRDSVNRYKENMPDSERVNFPQFLEEENKLETRIKRLEKNKTKLIELINSESVIADEALTIREARKLPNWSDHLELEFQKISDPDANDMSYEDEDKEAEPPNDHYDNLAMLFNNMSENDISEGNKGINFNEEQNSSSIEEDMQE